MNNEEEEKEERPIDAILRIFHGYMEPSIKREFPNLEFRDDGSRHQFGSCIGFMAGMYYGGQKEAAEKLAYTFFRSFAFAKKDSHLLEIWDDGCNLSFAFVLYMTTGKEGGKHSLFHGGIIFHGLQEVFSVSLCGGMGWSMHT